MRRCSGRCRLCRRVDPCRHGNALVVRGKLPYVSLLSGLSSLLWWHHSLILLVLTVSPVMGRENLLVITNAQATRIIWSSKRAPGRPVKALGVELCDAKNPSKKLVAVRRSL